MLMRITLGWPAGKPDVLIFHMPGNCGSPMWRAARPAGSPYLRATFRYDRAAHTEDAHASPGNGDGAPGARRNRERAEPGRVPRDRGRYRAARLLRPAASRRPGAGTAACAA